MVFEFARDLAVDLVGNEGIARGIAELVPESGQASLRDSLRLAPRISVCVVLGLALPRARMAGFRARLLARCGGGRLLVGHESLAEDVLGRKSDVLDHCEGSVDHPGWSAEIDFGLSPLRQIVDQIYFEGIHG